MECVKCGSACVVANKRTYHPPGDKHPYEVRTYVCQNLNCLYAFAYRNTFMEERHRRDAAKFLEQYAQLKRKQAGLFDDDEAEVET